MSLPYLIVMIVVVGCAEPEPPRKPLRAEPPATYGVTKTLNQLLAALARSPGSGVRSSVSWTSAVPPGGIVNCRGAIAVQLHDERRSTICIGRLVGL